jgi:DNA-binding MarR family transcriptional regulator
MRKASVGWSEPAGGDDGGSSDPIERATANCGAHGWTDPEHLRANLSILRVEELIQAENARILEPLKLTHSRHEALGVLYFSTEGQRTMSDLGNRLLLHPTSITSTVDSLERLGFVERVPHPVDRRATMARITDSGRRAFEGSATQMLGHKYGLAALTAKEAQQLFVLLRKVRIAAGDLSGREPAPAPKRSRPKPAGGNHG